MGECIGYARVSSTGQSLAIQLERLESQGCTHIFREIESGTTDARPQLAACLDYVRAGDTCMVTRIDRLARSTLHLCEIAARLKRQGVALRVIDQNIETQSPAGVLHFQMLGAIAEFETALRKERQMEGIRRAQALGKHLGRAKALTEREAVELASRHHHGWTLNALMQRYDLSKASIYRYLAQAKQAASDLEAAAD